MAKRIAPATRQTVYSTADLLRLTRATKGNLIHWSAIRLIRPDVEDATGSGHHKQYSALNVVEVEIATQLNKFKIPTALIADGIDGFRVFHEQCVALWTAGPLDQGEQWTEAQRHEFDRVMVRSALLRDLRGGVIPKSPSFYARALKDRGFTDNEQRKALQMAGRWRQVLREPAYLATHFFGLFVNPQEDWTLVADEPFELHDLMTYAVVVVNLSAVMAELRKAVKERLLALNPAADLDHSPRRRKAADEDARLNCWSGLEARTFLATAKAAGAQAAALYTVAIDSGARKGELCGLAWEHVDLETGTIRIMRQLTKPGPAPTFGPPKNGCARDVTLSAETVDLIRQHKRAQAELKMANRTTYRDHGLVFAKEYGDLTNRADMIGLPLQANHLGQRQFARLVKAANVKTITFHGMRHTCATLLLQAGEPVHVVSKRLGHARVEITLNTYAHVLPDMQKQAAATMGALLHG